MKRCTFRNLVPGLLKGVVVLSMILGIVTKPANAHFLWLIVEGEGEEAKVHALFNDPPIPDLPEFMKYISKAHYQAEGESLETTPAEDTFVVKLPRSVPRQIDGECDFGVLDRGGESFRLYYTARVQFGPAISGTPEPSDLLRLRLIAQPDAEPKIQVTFDGRPAPKAEVKAYMDDGSDRELIADEKGYVDCPELAQGHAGLRAKWVLESAGEAEGKPFEEIRYYTTLTVAPADALNNAGPATLTEATPFAQLPEAINSFGGAVSDGYLYVYSGHIGRTHFYHEGTTTPHFRRLNLKDRETWEELPCGPALQGVALVASDGLLYRVGGMAAHNGEGEPNDLVSVADFARFDPKTNSWEELPMLPEPRSTHDAVVLDGVLYVLGGWCMTGGSASNAYFCDDAYSFDLKDPQADWKPLSDPPFFRRALATAAVNGKIYVLGGLTEEGKVEKNVDIYDIDSKTWSRGPELPGGRLQGFAPSAFGIDNRLFVSGVDGLVHRLSDSGESWEAVAKLAEPRLTHRLLPGPDGRLLIVGGNHGGKPTRSIESVSIRND